LSPTKLEGTVILVRLSYPRKPYIPNIRLGVQNIFGVPAPETPPNPSIVIPFSRDTDFVERAILDQIHQKCAVLGSWTALVGLGGVG